MNIYASTVCHYDPRVLGYQGIMTPQEGVVINGLFRAISYGFNKYAVPATSSLINTAAAAACIGADIGDAITATR